MDRLDQLAFAALFNEAYQKCFGLAIANPMTETEAKIFCNKILDQTGLSIGWKSVKNYSIFLLDKVPNRQENPSVATLDTVARYVLGAPYTNEIQRKNDESHHPYWFLYREKFAAEKKSGNPKTANKSLWLLTLIAVVAAAVITYTILFGNKPVGQFTDDFHHVDENSLLA